MKIKRGYHGGWFAVFKDEAAADRWYWLFCGIFRRYPCCFGAYSNAYYLWGQK